MDYLALCKLAVEFSDGIMVCSEHVNEEVLKYAEEHNKPILPYQPADKMAEATDKFYKKLLETDKTEAE
jgi:starch synthase